MTDPTEQEIAAILAKLVLYPNRKGGNIIEIPGGPEVGLFWDTAGGLRFRVTFKRKPEWRVFSFVPETQSTGRSLWVKSRTHRLTPKFIQQAAAAIAKNPKGISRSEREAGAKE